MTKATTEIKATATSPLKPVIPKREFKGLLVIGDPHIEGRQPGFRKDDFPKVILEKIRWCLEYCAKNQLLPVFLGDIFDKPRDNQTWLICELIDMMRAWPAIGIFGNHDCRETELNEHDSLSLLIKSRCFALMSPKRAWTGTINGRQVIVGGSSYRQEIPKSFAVNPKSNPTSQPPIVIWLTHHDIDFAGYDSGRFAAHEIENVDLLINGHIHRRLPSIQAGKTTWMNPGNISRRSRSEANKLHVPRALKITFDQSGYQTADVEIPHQKFDEIFHEIEGPEIGPDNKSPFVTSMRELLARRTESGAGLHEFLKQNCGQFKPRVADYIQCLADEVTNEKGVNEKVVNEKVEIHD